VVDQNSAWPSQEHSTLAPIAATSLTGLEREYIAKRLMEEQSLIETLSATMLPHLLEDPVVSSRIRVQPDRQSC
jgi:hypothetical protein